jgi:hypothetical protein
MHQWKCYEGKIRRKFRQGIARDGVCRREYQDRIATSHSTLIAFSAKITRRSKFHQGIFLSQFLSGNFMVEFLGQYFRTTCTGRQIDFTRVFINFLFKCTRWFKYDWDWFVCKQAAQVPVIFEPPCTNACDFFFLCVYKTLFIQRFPSLSPVWLLSYRNRFSLVLNVTYIHRSFIALFPFLLYLAI